MESEAKPSVLLICTGGYNNHYEHHYFIHAINLSDLLSCSCKIHNDEDTKTTTTTICESCASSKGNPSALRLVGCLDSEGLPCHMDCGVIGSEIIFAGGYNPMHLPSPNPPEPASKYFVFDFGDGLGDDRSWTSDSEREKPNSRLIIPECRKLHATLPEGRRRDVLLGLAGKLYCLPRPLRPSFQVLKHDEEAEWLSLPELPIASCLLPTFYATAGTNVFISTTEEVFCCDVAAPIPKWRLVSSLSPFPFLRMALGVEHGDLDGHLIIFACQIVPVLRPHQLVPVFSPRLLVYLMSNVNNLDEHDPNISMEPLLNVEPPGLPPHFQCPYEWRFVHLGGRKVCLVMTTFKSMFARPDPCLLTGWKCYYGFPDEDEQLLVLVMTFEYQFESTSSTSACTSSCNPMESTRERKPPFALHFLSTRIFHYPTKQWNRNCDGQQEPSRTVSEDMLGACAL